MYVSIIFFWKSCTYEILIYYFLYTPTIYKLLRAQFTKLSTYQITKEQREKERKI